MSLLLGFVEWRRELLFNIMQNLFLHNQGWLPDVGNIDHINLKADPQSFSFKYVKPAMFSKKPGKTKATMLRKIFMYTKFTDKRDSIQN